jgi:adenosyl cobinamide kinase/adenosyl cobinamide phosphate guanylyltransferase
MSEQSIEDQSVLMNFALNGTNTSSDIGITNDQSVNQTTKFIQNEISTSKLQTTETPVYTCISINPYQSFNQDILPKDVFLSPLPSTFTTNSFFTTPKRKSDLAGNKTSRAKKSKIKISTFDDVSAYLVDIFESINDLENEVLDLKNENVLLKNSHVIISNNLGLEVIHIKELETKYNELLVINKEFEHKNKMMYENQAVLNVEIKDLQKEKYDLYSKCQFLLDLNSKTAKEVEIIKSYEVGMGESVVQSTSKQYSDLFKLNNNKMSEPLQEIMKVVANNEEDKRKREKNLLLFGLKVNDSDKNFSTVKKLLNDIGIDQKCVQGAFYLNSKSDTSIIKLVTTDTFSKNLILNASKNLKRINLCSKTKISICQDLSFVDRQIHKNLVIRRNELNVKLKTNDDHYFGIRNNNVIRINKPKL